MAQPQTLNLAGGLPPEILQQQQALNRQQQMAQLLMQQGQSMPSGQMVSGRFVAPSFAQYLAPLAQMYVGKSLATEGDKAQADLAKALRQQYANEVQQYQTLLRGQEATPEKYTEMAGPFGEGVGPNNRDIPMPVAYQQAQAAVAPDPKAANLFGSTAYNPVLQRFATEEMFKKPKWVKAEYTDEKTGKTRQGVYDENSPDPISTFQVGGVKPEMTAYERNNLRLRQAELTDKGINVNLSIGGQQSNMPQGGTMPVVQGGMPQGGGQVSQTTLPVASADAKFTPATLPKYEYDPSMSPADNRAAQVDFNKKLRTNISNAKDSFGLLSTVADTLSSNQPSSGGLQNVATTVGEFVGFGGKASQADATLKILGERLTAQVPRFEGPQSDKDTASYRTAAGDVGNANKPISTRIAAVKTMIELNKKYYPNGDWDSIDIAGPVNRRYNPYLPTVAQDIGRAVTGEKSSYSPQEFRKTLNPQDQAAFDFVRRNPNHKDTPAIKKVLGIE
jgi:hypothetical protein